MGLEAAKGSAEFVSMNLGQVRVVLFQAFPDTRQGFHTIAREQARCVNLVAIPWPAGQTAHQRELPFRGQKSPIHLSGYFRIRSQHIHVLLGPLIPTPRFSP